jgi:hypothetical protein
MIDQTDAGWRGRRHSPETRAKMSASAKRRVRSPHSPETRAKNSRAAEHIAKLAAAKRGRTLAAEHRAKIAEHRARMR